MDMSMVCRSCMKEAASWELANFDKGVAYIFQSLTDIEVVEDGSLPKQFCLDCVLKIESCYKFIQEAKHVNATLINLQERLLVEPETFEEEKITVEEAVFDAHEAEPVHNDNVDGTNVKEAAESKKRIDSEQKYVCELCNKTFMSKVWFEKHTTNHGQKMYSCLHCAKSYHTPSQLSVHAISHSDERRFECACGKKYKRRKELTVHARTHGDARPYTCDHCNMSFKLKSVLKSHLVLHQPDKPYLCAVCGCSFTQAGNLSAHMRTHTGAKPYACACGFRAAAASSLRRHERGHRALRPHSCRACRKAFRDASALTRHERSHTGARPYQCPGCARAFSDSWKRKCHIMRAHKLPLARIPRMRANPYSTVGCDTKFAEAFAS